MKKAIVLGILVAMVMGLSVAANAAYVKDTDWAVYLQAGSTTWTTVGGGGYSGSGTSLTMGNSATIGDTQGASPSSGTAVIRQLVTEGGNYGYSVNYSTALDQTDAVQVQTWDNIAFYLNGTYGQTTLAFRIWGAGIDANGPDLKLECVTAMANSGFTVGQSWTTAQMTGGDKRYPAVTLSLNAATLKALGSTATNPIATFKLTATVPANVVEPPVTTPEPGSMLAMFSGLVGLVGFGIRRRK